MAKEFSVGLPRAVHDGHDWLHANAAAFVESVSIMHGGDDGLVDSLFNEYKRDRVIRDAIEWLDDHAVRA